MARGGTESAGGPGGLRRALRVLRTAVAVAVLVGVVEYVVVPQLAGSRQTLHLLADIDNSWLALGVVLEVLSIAAYGRLTQVALRHSGCGYSIAIRVDLATLALSHVVPAGSAAGIGLGLRLLGRAGVSTTRAAAAKGVQTVSSALVLNAILWCALIGALLLHPANSAYLPVVSAGGLLLAAVVVGVRLVLRHQSTSGRVLSAVLRRLPWVRPDLGVRIVDDIAEALRALGREPDRLRHLLGWAAVNWLLDAAALWCFVRAFGHSLGPVGLLVSYGLANVAAALPLTPGGLGVVEGLLATMLVAFSTPHSVAIVGVLAWRLVNFWLPIPAGALAYLSLARSLRRGQRLAYADGAAERSAGT